MKSQPVLRYERKRSGPIAVLSGLLLAGVIGCLDPYNAPSSRHDVKNLVVDAFLNASNGTCTVQLSRSVTLDVQQLPPFETGAVVLLVDDTGLTFILPETSEGTYTGASPVAVGSKIKLKIQTRDKANYQSEEVDVLRTGRIDTVTWGADRVGVPVYITSRNSQNDSPYYYWKYTETWAYHARYETAVTLDKNNDVVPLTEAIFLCWSTLASTDILVGSSSTLNDNTGLINQFPLVIIPWESPKIQYRYSILIEQHAISKATFDYLEELKKNTENLGTLFDPLPSAPAGNIKCVTYPEESVHGNFTASTVSQKRIFFYPSDLARPEGTRSVTGYEGCFLQETRGDWSHDFPVQTGNGAILGTTKFCVDCRLNGGTTIQPDFWEW